MERTILSLNLVEPLVALPFGHPCQLVCHVDIWIPWALQSYVHICCCKILDEHRQCVCRKLIQLLLQLFYLKICFDDLTPCIGHTCQSHQCRCSVFHPVSRACSPVCSQCHSPCILSLGFLNIWLDIFVLHTFVWLLVASPAFLGFTRGLYYLY